MKRQLHLCLLFSALAATTWAQAPLMKQTTLWYRLYATRPITERLAVGLLIEDRKFINPWRSHIFLTELNVHRKIGERWRVGLHGTYLVFALPHDPSVQEPFRMDEMRWHQSVTLPTFRVGSAQVSVRSMLEQRFFRTEGQDGDMGTFTYRYLRLRNRVKVKVPITARLALILSEEHMLQSPKEIDFGFDQNRAGASAMIKMTEKISLELGYLHWYQVRPLVRYSRHSLRTGIYFSL